MKLHQVRAFLAALEAGSFSEAALDLGLSQASVSASVAGLERDLGVRLLDRGRNGAKPTPAGIRIAEHARRLLQVESAMVQEAALERGELRGSLRVATYPSAAAAVIPGIIATMNSRYPDLEVLLDVINDNEGLEQSLREGRADVILVLNRTSEDLLAWEVFHVPYFALIAPEAFPPHRESVGYDELSRWPLILHKDNQCAPLLEGYLAKLGINADPVQRVNDTGVLVNLVARGLGVGFLPELSIQMLPEGVTPMPLEEPLNRTYVATVLPANLKIPAVRAFLSTLREAYPESALPPLDPLFGKRADAVGHAL